MENVTNLLAEHEWWRIFGNDPLMAWFLILCAIPFIIVPILFVVNAVRSVSANVKTLATPKAVTLNANLPRQERNAGLTTQISPPQEFVLAQGELGADEVGSSGVEGILDAFERSVIRSPDIDMSLARIKGGSSERDSFLIVYRASPAIHFLGWATSYNTGITVQWKLKAAEVRAVRSPEAGNSHFNYDPRHEQTLFHTVFRKREDDSGLGIVWDLATGNVMTEAMGKKASWFRSYLIQRLEDALSEVFETSAASRPQRPAPVEPQAQSSTPSVPQPKKSRPTRRD